MMNISEGVVCYVILNLFGNWDEYRYSGKFREAERFIMAKGSRSGGIFRADTGRGGRAVCI